MMLEGPYGWAMVAATTVGFALLALGLPIWVGRSDPRLGRACVWAMVMGLGLTVALQALSELCCLPVVPLPLVGNPFYHLDTCLAVLDEDTLLIHPPAFRDGALQTLRALFPRLLIADPLEAETELAVNAHGLAHGTVLLPARTPKTQKVLAEAGYSPLPVDVSEFHKSGGSVFCMRLDLPA